MGIRGSGWIGQLKSKEWGVGKPHGSLVLSRGCTRGKLWKAWRMLTTNVVGGVPQGLIFNYDSEAVI